MTGKQHVLVVDGLSETEEVLRAVLEPRGLSVDRVRSTASEELAAHFRPSVMVLHVDEEPASTAPGSSSSGLGFPVTVRPPGSPGSGRRR